MPASRIASVAAKLLAGLLAIVLVATAYVFAQSERLLRREHELPLVPLTVEYSAAADSVEGRRMAIIVGCLEGCHGQQGEGGSEDAPGIFRATAPTLSEVLPSYSDPELVRLIRYGVKRDSVTAVGMPSATFYPMSDADLSRVIGYLRQRPVMPPVPRSREVMFVGRLALALGKWQTSADAVDETLPRWGHLPRITPLERGRYIASIVCSECHGLNMQGDPQIMKSPPLSVVRGYRIDQFRHLLRTGEPISGRDLGIMSITSRRAFVYFTDDEVADLYEYLRAQPVAARLKAGN